MKDTYYFSHDSNARNDEKILTLRAEYGYEGYGIYWALIEMMFENEDTALRFSNLKGIAYQFNIDITLLSNIISTAITLLLFESDEKSFWSNSLRKRKGKFKDSLLQKSEAGKKGMKSRWNNEKNTDELHNTNITPLSKKHNTVITPLQDNHNDDITLYNKGKERKGKKTKYRLINNNNNTHTDKIFKLYYKDLNSKNNMLLAKLFNNCKINAYLKVPNNNKRNIFLLIYWIKQSIKELAQENYKNIAKLNPIIIEYTFRNFINAQKTQNIHQKQKYLKKCLQSAVDKYCS